MLKSMNEDSVNPVLAEVTRGPYVESVHRGAFALVDARGHSLGSAGDIAGPVFPRSAIKMFQAVPLVESGAADAMGLGPEELALACASHGGTARHVAIVKRWLECLGVEEGALVCGAALPLDENAARSLIRAGAEPTRLHHNCSGKHAGFLTVSRHIGAADKDYAEIHGAVQTQVQAALAAFMDLPETIPHARDGCGAPAFALPLAAFARGLARFADGKGLPPEHARAAARLRAAMLAHPDLVASEGRPCTELMRAAGGAVLIKAGAEGVFGAALPAAGIGLALKIDDGASRAAQMVLAALLVQLGVVSPHEPAIRRFLEPPVLGADGIRLGQIRAAPRLREALGTLAPAMRRC